MYRQHGTGLNRKREIELALGPLLSPFQSNSMHWHIVCSMHALQWRSVFLFSLMFEALDPCLSVGLVMHHCSLWKAMLLCSQYRALVPNRENYCIWKTHSVWPLVPRREKGLYCQVNRRGRTAQTFYPSELSVLWPLSSNTPTPWSLCNILWQ